MFYLSRYNTTAFLWKEGQSIANWRIWVFAYLNVVVSFAPKIFDAKTLATYHKYWWDYIPRILRPFTTFIEGVYRLLVMPYAMTKRGGVCTARWYNIALHIVLASIGLSTNVLASLIWYWLCFPISYPLFMVRNWKKFSHSERTLAICFYIGLLSLFAFSPLSVPIWGFILALPHLVISLPILFSGLSIFGKALFIYVGSAVASLTINILANLIRWSDQLLRYCYCGKASVSLLEDNEDSGNTENMRATFATSSDENDNTQQNMDEYSQNDYYKKKNRYTIHYHEENNETIVSVKSDPNLGFVKNK